MHPVFALVVVTVLGIDVGWKPLEEGGVEYIIQISPDQVEQFISSQDLLSDVPAGLDVRRYRITVGTDELPRDSGTTVPTEPTIAKKEVVAEGSIPTVEAVPVLPKIELPSNLADTANHLEGPVFPSSETTVNKPTVASYNDHFPTPLDEEAAQPVNTNRNTLNAEAPLRDSLFEKTNSSPLRTRALESPAETDVPSLPRSRTRGFADDDYRERTQETLKPSTSGPSLRTADLTSSRESSFDQTLRDTDNNWGPIVAIFFFLLLSLGANFWLGWIALEARQRYQILLEKYRSVGGKTSVELV